MKRLILTGILALATGLTALMAQAQGQKPAGPAPKSQGEAQALGALMQQQGNPDAFVKSADEFLTKYADTDFKEAILISMANAYQQKNDADKAQIYAERALEVNPKAYQAQLLIGEVLASHTRENDLDKEEKLSKAEKNLNAAIANVNAAQKPNPQITDAQWDDGKKFVVAEAHNGLGMAALVRKKYDVAINEFKSASDTDPQPTYMVRLASAYESAGKHAEAIAVCDKVLADPQLHPQIKSVATNIKSVATNNSNKK
jgi:tetratricopeptide (TPR) repeat protein